MIALPSTKFSLSVKSHNVDLNVCCDWMEASALFMGTEVTGSDVVDILRENSIYKSQDFAWELVGDAFAVVTERARVLGAGYPFSIDNDTLTARSDWTAATPYAFCLVLSLAYSHPTWAAQFGRDYTQQGDLFELLSAESVASLLGWTVHRTGWSKTTTAGLRKVAKDVAETLGEFTGELTRWTRQEGKEGGLDLVSYKAFPDGRPGMPTLLWQCASGRDWNQKLKTPDLRLWEKAVTFTISPKKGFSMPFALDDKAFQYHANLVDGLLLDRCRLLTPGRENADWLSQELSEQLVQWLTPRVEVLPALEAA